MPRQVFTAGEILTAANMNDLADSTVMVFDDSAARGSAIPTPSEGMVTYLKDTNQVSAFNGSSFAPIGTILQVVSTTKTDAFSMSSATFADITGLSVAITPSSTSSKIWVTYNLSAGANTTNGNFQTLLLRDSTSIGIGDAAGSRTRVTNTGGDTDNLTGENAGFNILDTPGTTSAITYKLQIRNNGASLAVVNRQVTDTDTSTTPRSASSITVMEVAG